MLAMGRFADAAHSYRKALVIAPDFHESRVPLSTCLQALGQHDAAIECCEMTLQQQPGNPQAHWNLSMLLLLTGAYRRGWHEYEWRWETGRFPFIKKEYQAPRWQGEDLTGKRLLIHAEQGFGDSIQFCRYLSLLAGNAGEIIFSCDRSLHNLFSTAFAHIKLVTCHELLESYDFHVPLLSLPLIFGTTLDNIPSPEAYLFPDPVLQAKWRKLLESDEMGVKAGLCWHGRPKPDPLRSCPAKELNLISGAENVSCYSLQLGEVPARPYPRLIDLTAQITDFADTAAFIAELELVITIDTAVAHLAGALGKTCWLLLPFVPDWRWGLQSEMSPWYNSIQLFRQQKPGDWRGVMASVNAALNELIRAI